MADAARATSAAPTFFDPVRIMKKILVDGGYGNTNNPSFEAYTHYEEGMAKEILGTDRVRWVNIGTGTSLESSTDQFTPPKREWKDLLLPNYVLRIIQTISDLEKIATDSERTAHMMRTLSNVDKSKLDYHRFSATNGVHGIRLDDYRAIDNKVLEQKTKEYLEDPNVEAEMRSLAKLLAEDYEEKFRLRGPRLEMEDPPLSPRPSSIRRIVTGQQPEVLDLLSPGAGVPSMAGASEATAETSDVNETPRSRNAMPDGRVSIALLQTDRTGVGDQFKIPDPTATDFDPPTRASTAPASV